MQRLSIVETARINLASLDGSPADSLLLFVMSFPINLVFQTLQTYEAAFLFSVIFNHFMMASIITILHYNIKYIILSDCTVDTKP